MTYPIKFHVEVASSYHAMSNHPNNEYFQFKMSHNLGLVTNLFCTSLNSVLSYIFQTKLNTKYSEQSRETARNWLNTTKAQHEIAEHRMFAIGSGWHMILW